MSTPSTTPGPGQPTWRTRGIARSTQRVRARAENVGDGIVDAAFGLLREVGTDFTVSDVVARARVSRRAFYQYFDGKDDLLVAIFEEVTLQSLAFQMAAVDAAGDDPVDRLRAFFVSEWTELLKSETERAGGVVSTRALAIYHQRLAETKPLALTRALRPTLDALVRLIAAARESGAIQTELSDVKCAAYFLHTTVSFLQAHVLGVHYDGELTGDEVWTLLADGIVETGPRSS